ncbi:hypothetical protein K1719_042375 [Acacia pycnantha]|nr:hypothetical protein K1719_042375 [Acacia pycnantha]
MQNRTDAVGALPPRVYVCHSIYKGKAALTVTPRPPEFVSLEVYVIGSSFKRLGEQIASKLSYCAVIEKVKTMDIDLALKIYIKVRATPKVVAAFAERKEFDKILIYSKQVIKYFVT